MGKRTAIITVIILISGLSILGYFLQQGRKIYFTDPYKSVSSSACIVIETVDLQSFMNSLAGDKGLFGELGKFKELDDFNSRLKFLAGELNKPEFRKTVSSPAAVISFYPAISGGLSTQLSLAVAPDIRLRHVRDFLKSSGVKTINEEVIRGITMLGIPYVLNNKNDTAYAVLVSGLLVFSSGRDLAEEGLAQVYRDNDVRDLPGYSRILKASGKNDDKIFIVFRNLPGVIRPLLKTEFAGLAEKAGNLADCAGADIYINEKGLVLSGFTESLDSTESLFRYKSGISGVPEIYKILPSSTLLFESVIVSDLQRQVENGNTPAEGLAAKLREYIGDEITKATIDIKERPVNESQVVIYELENRAYAEKLFLDEVGPNLNTSNVLFFTPDEHVKIPVYLTPFNGFAKAVLPGLSGDFNDSWFAFYDKFLITGGSYITISRLLYDNILNKTLANDVEYRDFESTLPSIAGYFFYCAPSRLTSFLARYLNDDITEALRSNKSSVGKFQSAGFQLASSNNMIYNSLSISYKEDAREESVTEWETFLDTLAAVKPFFFTNHISGAREIFIQDLKNNAYLINAAGRVLWKVPLRERITGTIYMIDFFRNGKYQILFSGRNYLHLLDRNGNYVERYPVRLRSPATNALALFDYDNNQNYRILIAGEDRMIYAYDRNGSSVKGWKPFRTQSRVSSEICWFRVSGKDYLVVADEASLYFLDRTGSIRVTLEEPVTKASGSTIRLNSASPSVVCSAPDGTVQHISFDGSVKKITLKSLSGDHSFDFFDVTGDGNGEYVFIDKGILYLYNHNRSEIFTRQFGSDELGGPINFVFSADDRKIGVFDIKEKLIYLIDRNGKTMNGFPLRGASMFSIGKLSDKSGWNLIVGGTDRFLYNYRLDTEIK